MIDRLWSYIALSLAAISLSLFKMRHSGPQGKSTEIAVKPSISCRRVILRLQKMNEQL